MNNCGNKTQYQYDALGRRTKKISTEQETEFLWNGDVLLAETQNDNQATIYVFEPYSFKPLAQIQNNEIYHYHLDHLGTPQELTANDGRIVWSARYKTYGNLALKDVDDVENNLRFQGQYFDQETGLHYNRHRYYNPNTGQFTQQDPIGLLGGLNNYQYAPNPVGWVDPFGLSSDNLIRYKPRDELTALGGSRGTAINRAWKLERELVLTTGEGTRNWSEAELEVIRSTPNSQMLASRMSNMGYTGHHINSVNGNGELGRKWAGDPRNIVFLENENHPNGSTTQNEHLSSLQGHRGDYNNNGTGRLIDRQAMIDQYNASKVKDCP